MGKLDGSESCGSSREKAKQVFDKIKTDGIAPTIKAVRSKLDAPIPLGYSSAGVAIGVGAGILDIKIGDRVASNGPHVEIVSVPRNLVAKIPDGVSDEAAAFTVLGAIALQGIRLAAPTFGETVMVIGLGLIGQLTAQLLLANGCRVIGTDLNAGRLNLAANKGVQPLAQASGDAVRTLTGGHGADAVIIAASGGEGLLELAADMCRKRGRIVLTGVADMKLSRDAFFKKELTFQVSASYGPGRYDRAYEQGGLDYPIGYVRWTEGRNFDAVLNALERGLLDVAPLISRRTPFEGAVAAYDDLDKPEHLVTLFTYSAEIADYRAPIMQTSAASGGITLIGAGAFAAGVLLPALKKTGASIAAIISKNGLSAATLAQKHGIAHSATDTDHLWKDESIGAVMIATPHNAHASLTAAALRAGKAVFVEKPLALSREELESIQDVLQAQGGHLTVGFNRRFAPLAVCAKELLNGLAGPVNMVITVNAGTIPANHWAADRETGGGRLLGEACHFIDLARAFVGNPITVVCANGMNEDVSILLRYADGSNAVVNYFSNGSKRYDKERIELYRAGCTIIIENWRSLRSYGFKKDVSKKAAQDKGHEALIAAWVKSLKGGVPPIPVQELLNSSSATLAVEESLINGSWIHL